jgi:hypothetical protein
MKTQVRNHREDILRPAVKLAALVAVGGAIASCDGANQGVQIGTGQNPDPVIIDFPIAYVMQPIPVDDNGNFEQQDAREQITFQVGANLFFRDRASPSAPEVNITEREIADQGDVRDVEIAYDGSKLLFSMRGPVDPNLALDDPDQPTWNIWEYTFETDELRRVITSPLTAENGHDIMPKYLPDGRIIFASTRQTRSQAIQLDESTNWPAGSTPKGAFPHVDEDRNEFAFNLHVIDEDGTGLEQVTFNQSHDLDPAVMDNGQVVFSRWDHALPNNTIDLYRMNPDGSSLEMLYGKLSHDTGSNGDTVQFLQPRQLEDGRMMALIRPFTDTEGGGELITIDTPQYLENTQPTAPNVGVLSGPAQADLTINNVITTPGVPSPGGRYGSAYPIQDGTGRLLVSWSQCRLIEVTDTFGDPLVEPPIVPCTDERLANVVVIDPDNPVAPAIGEFAQAPPLYGIWMYDPRDDTQLPVVPGVEGFMFSEVVAADPRPTPPTGSGHCCARGPCSNAGFRATRAIPARRQSRIATGRRPAGYRQYCFRCQPGQRHAGNRRLHDDRAGRFGHGQGACEHRLADQRSGRGRQAHLAAASQLDFAAARAGTRMHWLPRTQQRPVSRQARCLRFRMGRCDDGRRRVPEYSRAMVRRRDWRDHGRGSCPGHLRR